ncbi:MAG: hypothetical protein JNL30_17720 [Rubrivivax sp.]|nr:hypothetical protein [Rubrivivax sp.]
MQPGEPEPTEDDLLTEATLPAERRAAQRRWTVLERFDHLLPPTGDVLLPGSDPARLPVHADGCCLLLLRIEASDDREGRSDIGGGRQVAAGGVAGFALPVLRYAVGGGAAGAVPAPLLLAPAARPAAGEPLEFTWLDTPGAALLRLEVQPAAGGTEVLSALVRPAVARYQPPPWVVQAHRGQPLRWRVVALAEGGAEIAASGWRALSWPWAARQAWLRKTAKSAGTVSKRPAPRALTIDLMIERARQRTRPAAGRRKGPL